MYTDCISNSVILSNDYTLLKSGLCTSVQLKKWQRLSVAVQRGNCASVLGGMQTWHYLFFFTVISSQAIFISHFPFSYNTSWRNGIVNEAIVLECVVSSTLWDFKVVKKWWVGALLSVKCCYFMWNIMRQFWISMSEEEERKNIVAHLVTFWLGAFTMSFRATMSLVGQWYAVIKAYKFTASEKVDFLILSYIVCPHNPYI